MASITRNHLYTVDLNKPLTRQSCGILLAEGDNNGDCFSFALVRDGVNAALDGTTVVSAYMIRQDGSTAPVNGTYAGNTVSVTLPKACYAQEGHFALAVKVDMSGATTTVAVLDGFIKNVTTDTVVDPGTVIPTLEDLLAQIERMETATEAANTAANNAKEFIITVNQPAYILDGDTSGITSDKTFAEIQAAITAGKTPVVRLKTQGKLEVDTLHLYKSASMSIVFRQQVKHTADYNIVSALQCNFTMAGGVSVDSVNFRSVPDGGTDGQVLVHKGESTYEWRDPETAPPIISTVTGEIVTVSDSANRPLAGLRLYGKTTQDGVPTPSAPVPLVSVGAGGSITAGAIGKNLMPVGSLITYVNRNMMVGSQYCVKVNPYSEYTLSFKATFGGDATGHYVIVCGTADGVTDIIAAFSGTETIKTFYTGNRSELYVDFARVGGGNDANGWAEYTEIQLELGNTGTAYEPYKDGGSLTASTPDGLPGIPVTSGGNYTDASGQQWVCDEVDFAKGVYRQWIKKLVLTGSEYWNMNNTTTPADNNYVYYSSVIDNIGDNIAMCDKLQCVPSSEMTAYDNCFAVTASYGGVVYVRAKGYMAEDSLSAFKTMLAQYPLTLMHPLATPIETPLSASELASFRAMTSQKPTTTVYNDAGAGLGVDYIADTKNYIDQRISALLNA